MNNKKTNKKKNKAGTKKNWGFYLGIIGNVLMWAVIMTYFIVLPLYFKNGYEMIATRKYQCFMRLSKYICIIIGGYVVVFFATWGITKEEIKEFFPIWKIDVCMLLFVLFAFLSHITSAYKKIGEPQDYFFYEGSLYGASGWFMGFMTFLILVGLYFAITRFFKYDSFLWYPIILVFSLACVWGILNRYQVYPLEMKYQNEAFISSIGNINWMAGYESVLFPIAMGLFWASDSPLKRLLRGIPFFVCSAMLLLNGSDSLVVAFLIGVFVILLVSLKDEKLMIRLSECLCVFCLSGIGIAIIDIIFPGKRDYSSDFASVFVKMPMAVIIFVLCILLRGYLVGCSLKKLPYPKWIKEKCAKVLAIAAGATVAVFAILVVVNTKTGGSLPVIGTSSIFKFNPEWGSNRGATWTSGIMIFKDLSFGKKLTGVGPDMFYYALKDNEAAFAYAAEKFGTARLTNAHNEIITLLVNIGILGTASFVAMCSFAIKKFLEESKEHPYFMIYVLSMVMYLGNNFFSFEQITNVPFFFLTIAIGAAAVVKENRAKSK